MRKMLIHDRTSLTRIEMPELRRGDAKRPGADRVKKIKHINLLTYLKHIKFITTQVVMYYTEWQCSRLGVENHNSTFFGKI